MVRGARRLLLFRDDADRAAFLRILRDALPGTGVSVHAYVLMPNHYHLQVSADGKALSALMQRVNRLYSRGSNAKHHLQGHLYEGPYQAYAQPAPFWLLRTARYIDFNPVRAGAARRPEDFPWSSCRAYVRGAAAAIPLDVAPVLEAAGGRDAYAAFEPPASRKKPGRSVTATDLWLDHVAWLLAYAKEHGALLEGESPKTVAAYWAWRAGVPPRAIARALGYANGHSASVQLHSVRRRAEEQPRLHALLARPGLGFQA
jgi:REP element-mobilizing transposase RayT